MLKDRCIKVKRSANKKRIAGIILVTISLILCSLNCVLYRGLVFSCAFVILSLFDVKCSNRIAKICNIIWCILAAFVAVLLTQLLLNVGITFIAPEKLVLGAVAVGLFLSIVFFITMNYRTTVMIGIFAMLVLATVNHFVFWFRGSEFAPYDIFAATTALNVAEKYAFELTTPMTYSYIIGALYCFCGFTLPQTKVRRSVRNSLISISVVAGLFLAFSFGTSNIKERHFGRWAPLITVIY